MKKDGEKLLYPITKIYTFKGLNEVEVKEAYAGDIISLAGIEKINVGETVTDRDNSKFLPIIDINAPTIAMKTGASVVYALDNLQARGVRSPHLTPHIEFLSLSTFKT